MLVLAVEQGSPAPGAIERTLLDYAWSGHTSAATAPCEKRQCG